MSELTQRKILIPEKWRKFLLLFFVVIPFLNPPLLDNDIWFLLGHGRYVLQNGIPFVEPFSMHEGLNFVMQQWVTSVLFWLVYSTLGRLGLMLLMNTVYVLILVLIFKSCMLVTDGFFEISFGITIVAGAVLSLFVATRPQVFSLLFMAAELYILENYAKTGSKRPLFFLPLLSILMVNMHASMWLMLFVLMLPYLLDAIPFKTKILSGAAYPVMPLVIASLAMAAAGFINPYGLDAMTYLLRSYGVEEINQRVKEMMVPDIKTMLGKVIYGYMFILVMVYIAHKKGRSTLRHILLTLGPLYLSISAMRGFQIFIVCSAFPLAYYLKDVKLPESAQAKPDKKTKTIRIVLVSLIFAAICFSCGNSVKMTVEGSDEPPAKGAVDFMLSTAEAKDIRLYVNYNDGDYAEFMGIPSYLDARAEVFLKASNGKEDILDEYFNVQSGFLDYREFLEKYDFTHILASKSDLLYVYLKNDPDYRLTYYDDYCRVFEPAKGN